MAVLDIVIVNWNAGDHLRRCLNAVRAAEPQAQGTRRVILVDNHSHDGSLEGLPSDLPIQVIRNEQNRGFARACNQGAAYGSAEYILFLNPDTIPSPNAFETTVDFLGSNTDIGVVGAQLVDEEGRVARTCARPPRLWNFLASTTGLHRIVPARVPTILDTAWDHAVRRDVAHVMGAYLCIRRRLFEDLGGFDERFFVYYEDLDLCTRALSAGYRIVYLTEAVVQHVGGGASSQVLGRRLYYSLRSRTYFCRKHFGWAAGVLYAACVLTVELVLRLADASGSRARVMEVARAYGLLLRNLVDVFRTKPSVVLAEKT